MQSAQRCVVIYLVFFSYANYSTKAFLTYSLNIKSIKEVLPLTEAVTEEAVASRSEQLLDVANGPELASSDGVVEGSGDDSGDDGNGV
jgi:hypothetical protein